MRLTFPISGSEGAGGAYELNLLESVAARMEKDAGACTKFLYLPLDATMRVYC